MSSNETNFCSSGGHGGCNQSLARRRKPVLRVDLISSGLAGAPWPQRIERSSFFPREGDLDFLLGLLLGFPDPRGDLRGDLRGERDRESRLMRNGGVTRYGVSVGDDERAESRLGGEMGRKVLRGLGRPELREPELRRGLGLERPA